MSEQFAEQADVVVDNDTSALDAEPSVILDEDRLGTDPLEDGMDTAEGYSRDVRLGGTAASEQTDTLDERLPQEEPDAVDGVGDFGSTGAPVDDPLDPQGAVEAELLTEDDGEVELGLSSADGANEETGLAADSGIGEVAGVEPGSPTEGAEQQALHIEQES